MTPITHTVTILLTIKKCAYMARGLTNKRERFCQEYIKTGSPNAAYKKAYDAKRMLGSSVDTNAQKLLKNTQVIRRVAELREKSVAKLEEEFCYGRIDAMRELDVAIRIATEEKQTSALVSAVKTKMDLLGLEAPKKHVVVTGTIAEWLEMINGEMEDVTE